MKPAILILIAALTGCATEPKPEPDLTLPVAEMEGVAK
jgi:hypothetical protein